MAGDERRGHPGIGATVAVLLDEVCSKLASRPVDARTRELRAKADAYSRALERWELLPPTEAQRAALMELVEALCTEAESCDDEPEPSSGKPLARVRLKPKLPSGDS